MNIRTALTLATIACSLAHATAVAANDCPVVRLSGPEGLARAFGSGGMTFNERHLLVGDFAALSLCPGGDPLGCRAGAVFAFERRDGEWTATQTIVPPDIGFNEAFGRGIVLDPRHPGRFLTLSNRFDGERMGLGHVYEFDDGLWQEVARFHPPDGQPISSFGFRSAHHGDTMLINQSARVHRYRDVAGAWQYQDTMRVPDFMVPSPSPNFGRGGMALDDEWAFIGAPRDESLGGLHGSVVIYRRQPDGSLTFAQYLLPPIDAAGELPLGERFGSDLGFDGRTLVVGASSADRDFQTQGVAYVYELEGDRWTFRQELRSSDPGTIPGHLERFGGGISIEGDRLIVGYFDDNGPLRRAHLFRRGADGVWREAAVLTPGDAAPTPAFGFGYRSTMRGRWVVIVAMSEGTTGAAYVFDLDCILGRCEADLDADGTLTIFDFLAFQNAFQDADPIADFDGDGDLTLFDFLAFQDAFDAGCE